MNNKIVRISENAIKETVWNSYPIRNQRLFTYDQIMIFRRPYTWYPMRQRRVEKLMVWHIVTSSDTFRRRLISFKRKYWIAFSSIFSNRMFKVLLTFWMLLRGIRQLQPFKSLLSISRLCCMSAVPFSIITASFCTCKSSVISLFCTSSGTKSNIPNSRVNMNRKFFMLQRYMNSCVKNKYVPFLFLFLHTNYAENRYGR